jgi:hypothetical protein
MLIRRDALARLGDFAAVRADIIEDVRLGELLKGSGARFRVEHAPDLLRTRMQNGFRDVWGFLSRCMFPAMRYSHVLSGLNVFAGYAFVVAPPLVAALCVLMLAAGAPGAWPGVLVFPTLIVWAAQVSALMFVCRDCDIPVAYALTTPLGLSLFYTALLVSAIRILRGEGLAWRGRRAYERAGVEPPTHQARTVNSSTADK